ncbi:MAG: hypothetical protein VXZ83_04630 [Verrucomicrobiota bacterium]|nr:hypothetical protein [Verrucomicrobiota bacterium]
MEDERTAELQDANPVSEIPFFALKGSAYISLDAALCKECLGKEFRLGFAIIVYFMSIFNMYIIIVIGIND